jgi:predicted nucleic acid-binding protein
LTAHLVPFDESAALHFADIRADRTIRPPDAIQLACAAAAGVDIFVTNDARLSRKVVPDVPIMTSLAAVQI